MDHEEWSKHVPDDVAYRRATGRSKHNRRRAILARQRRAQIKRILIRERSIYGLITMDTLPADARLPRGLVDYLARVTGYSKSTIRKDIEALRSKKLMRTVS